MLISLWVAIEWDTPQHTVRVHQETHVHYSVLLYHKPPGEIRTPSGLVDPIPAWLLAHTLIPASMIATSSCQRMIPYSFHYVPRYLRLNNNDFFKWIKWSLNSSACLYKSLYCGNFSLPGSPKLLSSCRASPTSHPNTSAWSFGQCSCRKH